MRLISITNGTITKVSQENGKIRITISYREEEGREQLVELVLEERTIILGLNGNEVSDAVLTEGMTVSAVFSGNRTRSIPPQSTAYVIVITSFPSNEEITRGIILKVDRPNRSFIVSNEMDLSSILQFNVSKETIILNRFGRPMDFLGLNPGMRVQVRHPNFTTSSIPPQTAAFEIHVI